VDITQIPVGAHLQLEDGSTVEVVRSSTDGRSVQVRYLESPFAPALEGTEATCTDYEITGFTTDGTHTDTQRLLSE